MLGQALPKSTAFISLFYLFPVHATLAGFKIYIKAKRKGLGCLLGVKTMVEGRTNRSWSQLGFQSFIRALLSAWWVVLRRLCGWAELWCYAVGRWFQ